MCQKNGFHHPIHFRTVFTNIAEAQHQRKKSELVQDYQEFTGRIELLEDDLREDVEFKPAKEVSATETFRAQRHTLSIE